MNWCSKFPSWKLGYFGIILATSSRFSWPFLRILGEYPWCHIGTKCLFILFKIEVSIDGNNPNIVKHKICLQTKVHENQLVSGVGNQLHWTLHSCFRLRRRRKRRRLERAGSRTGLLDVHPCGLPWIKSGNRNDGNRFQLNLVPICSNDVQLILERTLIADIASPHSAMAWVSKLGNQQPYFHLGEMASQQLAPR